MADYLPFVWRAWGRGFAHDERGERRWEVEARAQRCKVRETVPERGEFPVERGCHFERVASEDDVVQTIIAVDNYGFALAFEDHWLCCFETRPEILHLRQRTAARSPPTHGGARILSRPSAEDARGEAPRISGE